MFVTDKDKESAHRVDADQLLEKLKAAANEKSLSHVRVFQRSTGKQCHDSCHKYTKYKSSILMHELKKHEKCVANNFKLFGGIT